MASLLSMVRQTVTSVASAGQGDLTLGPASVGYRTMAAAGAVDGRTYSYTILEGAKWENGRGKYNGVSGTFSRTTVKASSLGATAETFSASCVLIITPLPHDVNDKDVIAKGNSGTGTVTFDVSEGSVQSLTNNGSHTWAFSHWSPGYSEVLLAVTNAGAFSIAMPTIQWYKGDGTRATTFSSMGVTLQASGMNFFLIWTTDGGTTLHGRAI